MSLQAKGRQWPWSHHVYLLCLSFSLRDLLLPSACSKGCRHRVPVGNWELWWSIFPSARTKAPHINRRVYLKPLILLCVSALDGWWSPVLVFVCPLIDGLCLLWGENFSSKAVDPTAAAGCLQIMVYFEDLSAPCFAKSSGKGRLEKP